MDDRTMHELVERIGILQDRVKELEQRHERMFRMGTCEQVDGNKHKVRVKIAPSSNSSSSSGSSGSSGGSDDGHLTAWINYHQLAGALKHHSMPSDPNGNTDLNSENQTNTGSSGSSGGSSSGQQNKSGQQMLVISPDGDLDQSFAIPLSWSNNNQSPSNDPQEHKGTFGMFTWRLVKDNLQIQAYDQQNKKRTIVTISPSMFQAKTDQGGGSDLLSQTAQAPTKGTDSARFFVQVDQTQVRHQQDTGENDSNPSFHQWTKAAENVTVPFKNIKGTVRATGDFIASYLSGFVSLLQHMHANSGGSGPDDPPIPGT